MNALFHTPLETVVGSAWRRIDPASRMAFFAAVCVSVLAFGFEMTNLTLHHDDVNHIFIEDTILGHYLGRFGVGWLHYYTQNHFVMPFLQLAEGIAMMAVYGVVVARFWGVGRGIELAMAATVMCVFPYMAQVWQYNTTQATYSAAHLATALALALSARATVSRVLAGAVLYAAAFSIYQGVAANAATILVLWLLFRLLFPPAGQEPAAKATLRAAAGAVAAMLAGGALYFLAVSFMTIDFDNYQSAEKALKPGGGVNLALALPVILKGTRNFFLTSEPYFPGYLKGLQLVFLGASALACLLLPRSLRARAAALGLLALACFAPRSLQLLHAEGHFHELTLTSYAAVVAATALVTLRAAPMLLRNVSLLLALVLVAGYVIQCNWISTVSHLNTLAHYTTMTQVLARVRALPASGWDGRTIVVVGEYDMKNDYPFKRATGVAAEFMRAYHMDKMARLMRDEASFVKADPKTTPEALEFASRHPPWPHPESVGIAGGAGVVVLSKN